MEDLKASFEVISQTGLSEGKKNTKKFQDFIKDFSDFIETSYEEVEYEFMKEVTEFTQSAQISTVFKNKDVRKNLVKRCVVRYIQQAIKHEKENFARIETILEIVLESLTEFQILEIVRYLHYYQKDETGNFESCEILSDFFIRSEEELIEKILKSNSVLKCALGTLTVDQLEEFGLKFEFLSNEKLSQYFRKKSPRKIPNFLSGLQNVMECLEEHGHDLEKHLFPSKFTEPYIYSGECSNFVIQVFNYIVENLESCNEDEISKFKKLIEIFSTRCVNLKILLKFIENLEEKSVLEDVVEALKDRAKSISDKTLVVKTETPEEAPKVKFEGKLSVDSVLDSLFNLATHAFENKDFEKLDAEALYLFDELEEYIFKTKKFSLDKLQGKVFRALDAKVGSKCSMTEAKAWKKVIKSIWATGICKNQIEMDVLMKKANRFLSKKNHMKNKKKIKKEIKRRYKDKKNNIVTSPDEEQPNFKLPEETKEDFKLRMERKKASELISELECPNGCTDCDCEFGAPRDMKKFKKKVEGYYKEQLDKAD